MENIRGYLSATVYVFALIAMLEMYLDFRRVKKGTFSRNFREGMSSMGSWVVSQLVSQFLMNGVFLIVMTYFSQFAPIKVPVNFATIVLAFLVGDLIYYWKHRMEHEHRVFWAFHSVHHSPTQFNLTTALRLPWIAGISSSTLFHIPMALIGFNPIIIFAVRSLVLFYQFWIHTNKIGRLGWFDNFFNSPSNHRVHHGRNPRFLDKNHGGILMIWDQIFGTYQKEDETPVYGLTSQWQSYSVPKIQFHEYGNMFRDIWYAKSAGQAWKHFWGAP